MDAPTDLEALVRAGPTERLDRWNAATPTERFLWFYRLLDRVAVDGWTIKAVREALTAGASLAPADIERIRRGSA